MSVVVEELTKIFGIQRAVDDISFSAGPGEILGFLGPNGAGKSTTMKIATCFLPPTKGTVIVAGYDVTENPLQVRKKVGYLPENNPLYGDMYVKEHLSFIASLHGMSGKTRKARMNKMIEITGLSREQHKRISQLSKGYKQRAGLAHAMIHEPEVLILDEPTSGLDPNQIVEIRDVIRELSHEKTVILSTHIMQEVQALCDRVVIINQGQLVADDLVANLLKQKSNQQTIKVEFENVVETAFFKNIKGVRNIKNEGNTITLLADHNVDLRSTIFKIAADNNLPLLGLTKEERTLEHIFQQLTQKGNSN